MGPLMAVPQITVIAQGKALDDAPARLKSYLDCADGAVLAGYRAGPGKPVNEVWALSRGGEHVGTVFLELEVEPS